MPVNVFRLAFCFSSCLFLISCGGSSATDTPEEEEGVVIEESTQDRSVGPDDSVQDDDGSVTEQILDPVIEEPPTAESPVEEAPQPEFIQTALYLYDGAGPTQAITPLYNDMPVVAEPTRVYESGSGLTQGYDPLNPVLLQLDLAFVTWHGDTQYLVDPTAASTALKDLEDIESLEAGIVLVAEYRLADNNSTDNPGGIWWKDSFAAFNLTTKQYECYCDSSNYDHNIGDHIPLGQSLNVRDICENIVGEASPEDVLFSQEKGIYFIYNDVQCGNGPANDATDEDYDRCPGRVDATENCGSIGPKWAFMIPSQPDDDEEE